MAHMGKNPRILQIYTMLLQGESVSKESLAREYEVSEKSIQRDIEDLREFLENTMPGVTLRYSGKKRQYSLSSSRSSGRLDPEQLLLVAELVLQSGLLPREEAGELLDKLLPLCWDREKRPLLHSRIRRGMAQYRTRSRRLGQTQLLWRLEQAIQHKNRVRLHYESDQRQMVVWPQAVLIRTGLLYLAAFPETEPTKLLLSRLDKLASAELLPAEECPVEPLKLDRVPFSTGGELYQVRFRYLSENLQPIHIWLPGAQLCRLPDGSGWEVSVEVYGRQIATWLRAMGRMVDQIQVQKIEKQLVAADS